MYNDRGYGGIVAGLLFLLLFMGLLFSAIFTKWEWSSDNVSGIVYNTENDTFLGSNTTFSIRASEDTYVSGENRSSYCVPEDSPYKELVNKAAVNKEIKVNVVTAKGFWVKFPWTCVDNVTVAEVK